MVKTSDDWVSKVESPGSEVDGENKNRCIYKVPIWLKEPVSDGNGDQTPYVPEIISFGPYHWGKQELAEMEKHKFRCLNKILQHNGSNVYEYLKEMKGIEDDARACYERPLKMEKHKVEDDNGNLIKNLQGNKQNVGEHLKEMKGIEDDACAFYEGLLKMEMHKVEPDVNDCKRKKKVEDDTGASHVEKYGNFVEMLVLDGCFMLEFLRVIKSGLINRPFKHNDPVFSNHTIMQVIARDMIKLENQIPLIVLKKLEEIQDKKPITDNKVIPELVLFALAPTTWVNNGTLNEAQVTAMREAVLSNTSNKMLHCLDIFRSSLLYQPRQPQSSTPQTQDSNPHLTDFHKLRPDDLEAAGPPIGDGPSTPASTSASASGNAGNSLVKQTGNSPSAAPEPHEPERNGAIPGGVDSWALPCFIIEKTMSCFSQIRVNNYIMNCIQRGHQLSYEEIRIESEQMVYCVEDLREAGVKVKARTDQSYAFRDIDFNKGRLEIPRIKIDDATKTLFLNLIAYEQCHVRDFEEMHITGYVAFMDNLINSAADVRLLHQAGIIVHRLGSDTEVADMFNSLVKKVVIDRKKGQLSNIYRELNLYCTHKRHRWTASWRNEYMKNPWVIISIIGASVLFLATLLQTIYSVYSYHKPSKS